MSQQKELEALYQVSEVLLKAFEQIHQITGNFIKAAKPKKDEKPQESPKPQVEEKKKVSEKIRQKLEHSKSVESQKAKEQTSVKEKSETEHQSKKQQLSDKKQKKKQHPDKPKYPLSPYFRFNGANLEKIKSEYPDLAQKELVTISSMLWNKLSPEEKKPYEDEFQKEKKTYHIAVEKFYNKHPEERPKKGPHQKHQ